MRYVEYGELLSVEDMQERAVELIESSHDHENIDGARLLHLEANLWWIAANVCSRLEKREQPNYASSQEEIYQEEVKKNA